MPDDLATRLREKAATLAAVNVGGRATETVALLREAADALEKSPPQYPHWQCRTHGRFDAYVAVGCPECVGELRAGLVHQARLQGNADPPDEIMAAWLARERDA